MREIIREASQRSNNNLESVEVLRHFVGETAFRILGVLELSKASLKSIDIGIELDLIRFAPGGVLDNGFSFFRGFSQLEVLNLSGEKLPEVVPLVSGRLSSLAISSLPYSQRMTWSGFLTFRFSL